MERIVQDFTDRLTQSRSTDSLIEAMKKSTASLDISRFAYVNLLDCSGKAGRPVILNTYPEAWQQRYFAENYSAIDPILNKSNKVIRPFVWDTNGDDGLTESERSFFEEAQEFEIHQGITVPIRSPIGNTAFLTLLGNGNDKHFEQLVNEREAQIHLLALYFHATFMTLARSRPGKAPDSRPELTGRERECLTWAALGKTKWEIARILNISKSTVGFHLQNTQKKYGVYSVIAAVALAVQNKDITI